MKKGIHITNNLMQDIQRFYPDEFILGKRGLEIIENETGVKLKLDEAGFIALHIVNAETDNGINTNKVEKATKIIEEILDIVFEFSNQKFDEESLAYYRFITHLKYFAYRIVNQSNLFTSDKKDKELLDMMKITYEKSYMCAVNIMEFVRAKYGVDIGDEELLYLVIHIQRAMFNN
ncbi:MAG: PRD domain-containing protein [Erysipelotrichaceae bacterium]|nr:PRD domain-containing protein [Erysipelotrichaceae bacterium]